jgi:hypothetical protein
MSSQNHLFLWTYQNGHIGMDILVRYISLDKKIVDYFLDFVLLPFFSVIPVSDMSIERHFFDNGLIGIWTYWISDIWTDKSILCYNIDMSILRDPPFLPAPKQLCGLSLPKVSVFYCQLDVLFAAKQLIFER